MGCFSDFFFFFGFQDLALVLSAVEMQSPNHWTAGKSQCFSDFEEWIPFSKESVTGLVLPLENAPVNRRGSGVLLVKGYLSDALVFRNQSLRVGAA